MKQNGIPDNRFWRVSLVALRSGIFQIRSLQGARAGLEETWRVLKNLLEQERSERFTGKLPGVIALQKSNPAALSSNYQLFKQHGFDFGRLFIKSQ